ncbi:MAG: glycosyltransferase, partial [Phycisphaerales bacterium]|nr:glycosyltransferase [Phycisphaerales bacterium]
MRLLHIISSLDPAQGGPPVVVSRLGAAQQARSHSVSVLGYAHGDARSRIETMFSEVPQASPCRVHLIDPGSKVEQLRAHRARRWLQEHLNEFDLLHLHGVWDPILSAAGHLAKSNNVPWIITPHGMLDPWCMSQGWLKKQLAIRTWVRPLLRQACFIHALNADECDGMRSLTGRTPMEVVPNGVFLEELAEPESKDAFRSQHPELGDDP